MKNVTRHVDRHGKVRLRFRMVGRRDRYLKALPGTPEFQAEIQAAIADVIPAEVQEAKAAQEWSRDLVSARHQAGPVVYFVGASQGPVKIGHTSSLHSRLIKLQVGHPHQLRVLAILPGDAELEAQMHERFSAARIRGEWFKRTSELRSFMREVGNHSKGYPKT